MDSIRVYQPSHLLLAYRLWEKLKEQEQLNLGRGERKRNEQRCSLSQKQAGKS